LAAASRRRADAALSATEKAAKALEIAREEQEHIRREIKRKLENYGKLKRRKAKKVGRRLQYWGLRRYSNSTIC